MTIMHLGSAASKTNPQCLINPDQLETYNWFMQTHKIPTNPLINTLPTNVCWNDFPVMYYNSIPLNYLTMSSTTQSCRETCATVFCGNVNSTNVDTACECSNFIYFMFTQKLSRCIKSSACTNASTADIVLKCELRDILLARFCNHTIIKSNKITSDECVDKLENKECDHEGHCVYTPAVVDFEEITTCAWGLYFCAFIIEHSTLLVFIFSFSFFLICAACSI